MSALLDFAAEVRAVCEERDSLRIARADAVAELVHVRQAMRSETRAANAFMVERDQARAELAGVTAQRDAHLSRSVELAARVTELEARLAAVTPAVDEVDGFRAGDLVCHKGCAGSPGGWGRVITLGKRIEANFGRHGLHTYLPNELERKPVEVGDAVREVHSGLRGEVFKANEYAFDVRRPTGQMSSWSRDNCIAIAPTVKP